MGGRGIGGGWEKGLIGHRLSQNKVILVTHSMGGLAALAAALSGSGCELDPLGEASDVTAEHGDAGEAAGMLMLAESLIRAALLQKPVLAVGFGDGGISVCVVCPAPQKPAEAGAEKPAPQLGAAA